MEATFLIEDVLFMAEEILDSWYETNSNGADTCRFCFAKQFSRSSPSRYLDCVTLIAEAILTGYKNENDN